MGGFHPSPKKTKPEPTPGLSLQTGQPAKHWSQLPSSYRFTHFACKKPVHAQERKKELVETEVGWYLQKNLVSAD